MLNHDQQDYQASLEELFSLKGWEYFKEELRRIYENADSSLHSVGCTNREFYVGKCQAIKDILEVEKCHGLKKTLRDTKKV